VIRFNCPHCERHYELPDALAKLPLVCKQCGQRITPPEPTPEPPSVAKPQAAVPVKPPAPLTPRPKARQADPTKPSPSPQPAPKQAEAKPTLPAPKREPVEDEDMLAARPDSTPDIEFNIGGPTAASLSEAARTRPAGLSSADRGRPAEPDAETAAGGPSVPETNLDLLPKPAPKPVPPRKPAPQPATEEPPADEKTEATLLPFIADAVVFVLLVVGGLFLGELAVRKPTGEILSEAGSAAKFPPIDLLVWAAPAACFALVYILLGKRDRTLGAWIRRRRGASPP
jgi:hypothetical protein